GIRDFHVTGVQTCALPILRFGLPLLPGSDALKNADHAVSEANRVGYPVMIKARGGGGGRGMRVARNDDDTRRGFEAATAEATNRSEERRVGKACGSWCAPS